MFGTNLRPTTHAMVHRIILCAPWYCDRLSYHPVRCPVPTYFATPLTPQASLSPPPPPPPPPPPLPPPLSSSPGALSR
eukprot:1525327-Rhodomonas_salina.1